MVEIIQLQDFCPLKIEFSQFPDEFRPLTLTLVNYYFHQALKVAACEIDKHFSDDWGIELEFN